MNVAQLIRRLQELQDQFGNLEIQVCDGDNDWSINGPAAVQVDIHEGFIIIDLTA